ncbi:MAG: hypothetical protein Q8M83_04980, partial [bacterium]|nr:hypothetical protein [bacterium]
MCFSASASFIAGSALSVVGAVAITKTKRRAEILFAMIPLLFGIQQIAEGFIWVSFRFDALSLNIVMTYIYSLFSHVLWPIFVPLAVGLLEVVPWRKKALSIFQFVGIAVSVYFLYFIVKFPIASQVVSKSIAYNSPHLYIIPVMIFYFAATCISSLFSSHKIINVFGITALLFAALVYRFYALSFVSVWCFSAAILSIMILLYFICVCCIY